MLVALNLKQLYAKDSTKLNEYSKYLIMNVFWSASCRVEYDTKTSHNLDELSPDRSAGPPQVGIEMGILNMFALQLNH